MALTWVEDGDSRSATIHRLGKKSTATMQRSYKVFGTADDVELHDACNTQISTMLPYWNYPGTSVNLRAESYSVSYLGDDAWQVTIQYEKMGADDDAQRDPLKRSRSFDTSGGTQHITQAVVFPNSTGVERRWGVGGENNAPFANYAIGVDGDSVAGVDIVVPQLTWTENYDVPDAYVTSAYIKQVAGLTGTVNSAAFRTFAAGEVLFMGCSGSHEWDAEKGNGPWSLSFKFVASPNAGAGQTIGAITIGGISGISKRGHDYLWVRYDDEVTDNTLLKKPKHVYVNRVYRDGNFSDLGIGTT
jgi:hypothetical protein